MTNSGTWCCHPDKWLTGLIGAFVLLLSISAHGAEPAVRIGGTGTTYGLMPLLAEAFAKETAGVTFHFPKSLGSSGGIRALLAGRVDIATTARPLMSKEQGQGLTIAPFARTPLAVVTSRVETNLGISSNDLVSIFRLELRAWPDGMPIRLIMRPASETDTQILTKSFRGFDEVVAETRRKGLIPTAFTDQDNMDMAERIPGSLTVTALLALISEGRNLRVVSLDNVAPTTANVANNSYPLTKTLYVVTKSDESPLVRAFLDFLWSPSGRAIIGANGGLPLTR